MLRFEQAGVNTRRPNQTWCWLVLLTLPGRPSPTPVAGLSWQNYSFLPARLLVFYLSALPKFLVLPAPTFKNLRVAISFRYLITGCIFLLSTAGPARPAPPAEPLTVQQVKARLKAAIESLKTLRCVIVAEERIGTKRVSGTTAVKLTNSPLRVYLKTQKAIEVLYVAGQNNGDAWVNPAAFPYFTLSLNPNGSLMRKGQHYTALQVGYDTIGKLLAMDSQPDAAFTHSFRYAGDSVLQGQLCHVLRADYPQFRYVAYRVRRGETITAIADRFSCGEYRILERNDLAVGAELTEGQILQVPNAYGSRVMLLVNAKTFLPASVTVYDERGLFEKYTFSNVIANQPIPAAEFTRNFPGYKL